VRQTSFPKGFDFAFEDFGAEVGDSAPGVELGQLDVFLEW
jgi:hypothetical protein